LGRSDKTRGGARHSGEVCFVLILCLSHFILLIKGVRELRFFLIKEKEKDKQIVRLIIFFNFLYETKSYKKLSPLVNFKKIYAFTCHSEKKLIPLEAGLKQFFRFKPIRQA
jgi:hypothetical protein